MWHDNHYEGVSLINSKYKKWAISIFLFFLVFTVGAAHPAAAGNVVTTAKRAAAGQWEKDENGKRYRLDKSGKYLSGSWQKIRGAVYYFDKRGYVKTGWINYGGKKYYADADGKLYVNKWAKRGKKYYYLRADGTLAQNLMVKSGKKYYYVNKNGVRVTNSWVTIKGKKYYFDWQGVRRQSEWLMYNKELYYLNANGTMAVNQWVDGDNYYVGADGTRMKDCEIDGYYLDPNGKKAGRLFSGDYIFVGDSRTEGMHLSVSTRDTLFIAKVSMGYSWLQSTAGPELKEYLQANPDVSVVLAFGVNDLANIDNYISYYKTLIAQFPDTAFYVTAVNPVNEAIEASHGYTVKNSQINAFNKKMKAAIGKDQFINTYKYLKKKGFQTPDGVHYTAGDYIDLYNYVIKTING